MASGHRPMGSPHLLLLFAFCSLFGSAAPADLASDRAALLAFRAAVTGSTRQWNVSASSPCSWYGVTCAAGRVTELRLPGSSLLGTIPPGSLGNLTALRKLSLRSNGLSGSLPSDFAALAGLQFVYLQHNRLSGQIPAAVFALRQLLHLDLSDNSLVGEISSVFNNITSLKKLSLEHNRLTGEIPDLRLPSLVHFNVSFNQLNGSIPASLRALQASSFIGNSLCGMPLAPCSSEISPSPTPSPQSLGDGSGGGGNKKLSAGAIAGIVIGSAVVFLCLLLLLVLCFRRNDKGAAAAAKLPTEAEMALRSKRQVPDSALGPLPTRPPPPPPASGALGDRNLVFVGKVQKAYGLEDLLRASAEVLGKGTTGTTYKTMMEMGTVVAVKRLRDVNLPEKEFGERIKAIAAMDHPNLVSLQAYYYSKDEKLLVYEYVPNGSLSSILHGNKISGHTPLNWEARLEIALGAARGIEYIHLKDSSTTHGGIKSSNILLDKSNEARVSDLGLSSLGCTPMPNQRAVGYRAPEVTDVRQISQKADVYSFGVLLMELLTGKPPIQLENNEDGVDLPRWVQSVVREEWNSGVFDLELLRYQNVEEEMVQLLQLAIDCAAQVPEKRPSTSEVVARMEKIRSSSTNGN
ncbi:hypothetical protein Cni_G28924 [Canna indica]|uniref:Protein kinase domain-containing protein n=1 Tax=Canna indica TaxID=4628 RepID=A0AAQ3L6B8_9LILI|nr:hypothetical protein Cni_G28924 [Canna indica]